MKKKRAPGIAGAPGARKTTPGGAKGGSGGGGGRGGGGASRVSSARGGGGDDYGLLESEDEEVERGSEWPPQSDEPDPMWPMTLPFNEASAEGLASAWQPGSDVDPSTSGAAAAAAEQGSCGHLFAADGALEDRAPFFLQLPTWLPFQEAVTLGASTAKERAAAAASERLTSDTGDAEQKASGPAHDPDVAPGGTGPFRESGRSLPTGHVGKLKVHASGRVVLHIGNLRYVLSEGMPVMHHQEAVAVDPKGGGYYVLGDVAHRLVVSPDVQALLPTWEHQRVAPRPLAAVKSESRSSSASSARARSGSAASTAGSTRGAKRATSKA